MYTATNYPSSDIITVTLERQLARLRKFLLILKATESCRTLMSHILTAENGILSTEPTRFRKGTSS